MQDSKLILICGRNAVLAQELEEMLWPAGYQVRSLTGIELGLLDIDRLRHNLTALAPALVINTIGYGPYAPFQPVAAADRKIIWRQPSGLISYWTVNSDGGHMRYAEHGPFGPWMATLTAGGRP